MNEARKSYKNGVVIGLGAMGADVTYAIFVLFGVVGYINQPIILNTFLFFGGSFLLYLAFSIFMNRKAPIADLTANRVKVSSFKLYGKGYLLTLLNPFTIAFWLSVTGYVASKDLDSYVTFFGILSAIFLWVTTMPYLVHKAKHKISQNVSYVINLLSSLILLGFSVMMFIYFASHMALN